MKLIVKILKWTAITITALLVTLFSLSLVLGNKVVSLFLASVNNSISTTLHAGSSGLSLIRSFPKAAVELKNLVVHSSETFDRSQFGRLNTDTLLWAETALLEFRMSDIIKGNYNIGSIRIFNGGLNIYSDSSGGINYEISSGNNNQNNDDEFIINLEKVIAAGIRSRYINRATMLDIEGDIENGRIKSRIAGENIDFICSSDLRITRFNLLSSSVRTDASVSIDISLHQSDSGILFRKGVLRLEDFRFGMSGFISSGNVLDLVISGNNIDLGRLKKYIPGEFADKFNEYSPSGILKTECLITGPAGRLDNPEIIISFHLLNGSIMHGRSSIGVSGLSFSGEFRNPVRKRAFPGSVSLEDFSFRIGSALWNGKLKIKDLSDPLIELTFSGEIIPSEIMKFIPVPGIISSDGSFRLNMNLNGPLGKPGNFTVTDFISLNPEAVAEFRSFGIIHENGNYSFDDAEGTIMFARNVWADGLVFTYKGQRFGINGEFTGLPAWLAGKPARIKAVAEISASNPDPLKLTGDSSAAGNREKKGYLLPGGMEADIRFDFENFVYRDFTAGHIDGRFIYRPGSAEFSSLNINALNGTATGDLTLVQNPSKAFLAKGNFSFENIDVNMAFRSFNNFGQDFLRAENIEGSLSGNLSILMPMDSMLVPVVNSVTAEGKYIIEKGKLVDFEPVRALSRFIELSELENISFSRLENDLFIRNNYLAIPQMDIRSSAADFTVNGRHSFDMSYQYHVKTYLSEILSRKAVKKPRNTQEFGAVEEDGLGRTSIYLKITGDNEDIKVGYDLKAAGSTIKQNLRNEKGNIRSILNQEYGLFRADTTIKQEAAPKPRFRIQFSETDTAATEKDTAAVIEERGIKRIFKKKKDQ